MAYSDFTLAQVKAQFRLQTQEKRGLFSTNYSRVALRFKSSLVWATNVRRNKMPSQIS